MFFFINKKKVTIVLIIFLGYKYIILLMFVI